MTVIRKVASGADNPLVSAFITQCGHVKSVPKPKSWQDLGQSFPIAVKDNITTNRSPTTCASAILQTHQSPFPAEVVTRLEKGKPEAIIIGKTNMDEFGMGSHSINSFFGPVSNIRPFPRHSAGGSSGGSAVAVAANSCAVALGTDTGGSIRLPAAYTGIAGFKPSYGRVSRWGVIPYANSLDTVGILASTVSLLRAAFSQVDVFDPKDPTSITNISRARMTVHRKEVLEQEWKRKLRSGEAKTEKRLKLAFKNRKIGVPLEYNISELDPSIREAWQKALQILQDNGATIVPISLPNTKHALSAYYVLAPAEAASNLSKYDGVRYGTRSGSSDGAGDVLYSNTRGSGFGDEVKRRILLGSYTLSSEAIDNYFIKAQKVRRLVQRDFDRVFAISNPLRPAEQFDLSSMDESIELDDKLGPPQVDFIVCPTAPTPPPIQKMVLEQSPVDTYMNDVFTVPASLAGLPAISIPFPVPDESRIPGQPNFAGIQIIGQYSDDARVLWLARDLEKLTEVTAAEPEKKHFLKLFDLGLTKHKPVPAPTPTPKPKKVSPSSPSRDWLPRLKMEKWKAMEKQRRAVDATSPKDVDAENKSIDQMFNEALVMWNFSKRQASNSERTLNVQSPEKGKVDADTQRNLEFNDTFRLWKRGPSYKQASTFEQAKESLDRFFDAREQKLKKEEGEKKKEPKDKRVQENPDDQEREPTTSIDGKPGKGYYD
ncbi:amidase signature domain-containing protein [Rhexocercosporidium sp. MPI-PUGE-AT-0058]|nr:amidase signature domain-containing protein [Rhexocercosporidium sp. MPI-PUGE-AT-0058]